MSLSLEKVRVPHTQQTTENGNVLPEGSLAEMLVHGMSTGEELVEVLKANVDGNAEADGTPDRVSATDPALEAKHVLAVDAELGDLGLVGGEGDKVLGNLALVVGLLEEPGLGCVGVGACLGGGKGLGGDEEEGGLGVGVLEGLGHVSAVNVGDEMEGHVVGAVVLEGLCDHDGAAIDVKVSMCWHVYVQVNLQIGTSNTDIDNGGQLLASVALPFTAADLLGELLHVLQDTVDTALTVHDIDAINLHIPTANVPQGSVVDGTALGEVDLLAGKHGVPLLLDAGLLGELDEEVEGLIGEEVLGEVEEDVGADALGGKGAGESVESVGVRGKGFLEDEALADAVAVSLEL